MSKPKPGTCFRCKGPRIKTGRAKGLCEKCRTSCSVCGQPPARQDLCAECHNRRYRGLPREIKDRINISDQKYHAEDPRRRMLYAARRRAKKRGIPCALNIEDLLIPTHCPVLGFELYLGSRKDHDHSPSLDLLVRQTGYVVGNVRVISHRANSIRGNATADEIRKVLQYAETIG